MARDEALIGCIGKLRVATRGKAGPGEVVVSVRGGTEAFIAWSPEPLPKGQQCWSSSRAAIGRSTSASGPTRSQNSMKKTALDRPDRNILG